MNKEALRALDGFTLDACGVGAFQALEISPYPILKQPIFTKQSQFSNEIYP